MTGPLDLRRTIALTAVPVLTLWSLTAAPALADSGHGKSGEHATTHGAKAPHSGHGGGHAKHQDAPAAGQGSSQGGSHAGSASSGSHGKSGDAGKSSHGNSGSSSHGASGNAGSTSHGNSANAPGHSGSHGNGGAGKGSKAGKGGKGGGGHAVVPGNNGTVKIAPLGEMDGIPNNSPHPGCTFQVEWYGFDEGRDIISTVSFAAKAPTADAGITVDGPSTVFVGGDPASGAGTDTGLDGQQAYTLSFTGAPHPKQGYHVKLTVSTPHSQGNDTKTKVFWVAPCTTDSGTTPGDTETGTPGDTETETPGDTTVLGEQSSASPNDTTVLGEQASASPNDTEVLGEQASRAPGGRDSVPTAVEAGENGHSAISQFVRSPWPLALVALGALVTFVAVAARRRSGARADISE